jgi:hypothetical protein
MSPYETSMETFRAAGVRVKDERVFIEHPRPQRVYDGGPRLAVRRDAGGLIVGFLRRMRAGL